MKVSRPIPWLLLGLLLGALVASAAPAIAASGAQEPPKKKEAAKERASGAEPTVFTNEDLERMFGGSPTLTEGTPAVAPADARPVVLPDPLEAIVAERAAGQARTRRIAAAESDLAKAQERVSVLEKRLLAIRNPYLPRPELTPEEVTAVEGKDGAQQAKSTEEELEAARREAQRAKATLERLRSE